jgi:hypothetical protein
MTVMNFSLALNVRFWIDKEEVHGYKEVLNVGKETAYAIERKFDFTFNSIENHFRNLIIFKMGINIGFTVILFLLSLLFLFTGTVDTEYMYQMTVSSFFVSNSASVVLFSHDLVVGRLDDTSEQNKKIKEALKIGVSTLNRTIKAYAVAISSALTLLLGLGFLLIPQLPTWWS